MTFEEFEKADARTLRGRAKECFDTCSTEYLSPEQRSATFFEAQFYMQELDRRSGSWIARRDFWLEIAVIVLILFEIVLGIYGTKLAMKQGVDEDNLMNRQNVILTNLQQSTADTATTMKGLAELTKTMGDNTSATAKTLLSLRSTTQEMNKAVQYQLALFYDPAITLIYDSAQNRALFQNTGRTGLTLDDLYVDGTKLNIGGPKLISGGTSYYLEFAERYKNRMCTTIYG